MELRNIIWVAMILVLLPTKIIAGWSGPVTVVIFPYGTSAPNIGIFVGDTPAYDRYPQLHGMLADGTLVIWDGVNRQVIAYNVNTAADNRFPIRKIPLSGDSWIYKGPDEYALSGHVVGYIGDETWEEIGGVYYVFDRKGRLIRKTPERPLELGREIWHKVAPGTIESRFEYPDRVYVWRTSQAEFEQSGKLWGRIGDRGLVFSPGLVLGVDRKLGKDEQGREIWSVRVEAEALPLPPIGHECVPDPTDYTTGVSCRRISAFGGVAYDGEGRVYVGIAVFPGNPNAGFHILKFEWRWEE